MKQKKNISLIFILIIALIAILSIFINFTGIASTFKYFLMFLVLLFISFGLSIWLNQKWISYVPSFLFIILMLVFIAFLIVSKDDAGIGRGLYVIFIIATIFLSVISYLAAILLDRIVINEETFKLQSLFIDYKEYIALVVGLIIFLNNLSALIKTSNASYYIPGIIIIALIFSSLYLIFTFIVYFITLKKIDLFKASTVIFAVYIPFSYLLTVTYRETITLGISLSYICLQIGLLIYIYRKSLKQNIEDEVEVII